MKSDIDSYFDYNIDIAGRKLFLFGEIDEDKSSDLIKGLYFLGRKNNLNDIELFVNSIGGCTDEMFAIHDAIATIKADVSTCAIGQCCSATPLIVACGTKGKRYSTENCTFMIHDWLIESNEAKLHSIKKDLDFAMSQKKRWADLMGNHTKMDSSYWLRLCKKNSDYYFDAQEAVALGIVDEIWTEKI